VKVKFIGTGSGITSLNRHHSSFIISSANSNILVDCGDGISSALLKQNIYFNSISSILISHLHADHYCGLPSLITQMKLIKRTEPLSIFVHSSLLDFIKDFILHSYIFTQKLGFDLIFFPFEIDSKVLISGNIKFISKNNSHLEKYKIYDIKNRLSFVSLSFFFEDGQNTAIYTGDIGNENDLFLFSKKVDWFITETTHIKLKNLAENFEKINPTKFILTHIEDGLEENLKQLIESLQSKQANKILIAYDGFELSKV